MARSKILAAALAATVATIAATAIAAPQAPGASGRMHGGMQSADTNNDGKVSRAEAIAHAEARFTKMDANRDGFIDRADVQLRVQQMRDEHFKRMDANNDGRITRAEFDAQRGKRLDARVGQGRPVPDAAQARQRGDARFAQMDANKDGSVSRQEFDAAKPSMRADQQRMRGQR